MTEQNINNIRSQMRKGILEYCVLLTLDSARLYPSDIIATLKTADLLVVEGTLYTLLNRLKREGKLEYEWVESKQGPPRKYYYITQQGREALKIMQSCWEEMSTTVNAISRQNKKQNFNEKNI